MMAPSTFFFAWGSYLVGIGAERLWPGNQFPWWLYVAVGFAMQCAARLLEQ